MNNHFYKIPKPVNSVSFFQEIKKISEEYWKESEINPKIYGFQIQKETRWREGLTDDKIAEFEQELGLSFSDSLKNFYRVMNGLSKPGINVFGSDGNDPSFQPIYYSFPDDLEEIKDSINWIYESNNLTKDLIKEVPNIFPVTGHRFIILDGSNQILSMYGDDIVFWADSIEKLIVTDIFDNIENISDFNNDPAGNKPVEFWLENPMM